MVLARRTDAGYTSMVMSGDELFTQSVHRQIALNQARSATERMLALSDLLDAARALAPSGPEAHERRLRALAARNLDREHWRAECKRLLATQRPEAPPGL